MGTERMTCCGALTKVYSDAGHRKHNPGCPTQAVEVLGSEEHYRSIPKTPHSKAHKCEVEGCNISQEEHHRLAYGMIAENRFLKQRLRELENGILQRNEE